MFYGCNSLINIDLSNFKTQNFTNIDYKFWGCNSLIKKLTINFIKEEDDYEDWEKSSDEENNYEDNENSNDEDNMEDNII